MPLSTLRRQQLDGIVQKMANKNAPKEAVQSVVNDFKSKYENEDQPKSDGILKSIAKTVANPFLKVGTAGYNVASSIGKLAQGDVQGADAALNKPRNIPFFGQTEPLVNSSDVNQPGMRGYLPPVKKPASAALQIASTIAPVGKIGSGVKGVLKSAGIFGTANAVGDVGSQLESGKPYSPVETIISFGLGSIIPISIGGTKGILGGFKNRIIGKTAGRVLDKELQTATPELALSIEKGVKSFGDKAAEIVDKKGNPLYVGNYETLLNKSKTDLIESGTKLNQTLEQLDKVSPIEITQDQVANDVIEKLQNIYGKLTPSQLKQVRFEVARMPKIMNRQGLLKSQRLYDGLIPDNFWTNTDQNAGFATQVKYLLRDNSRKVLNETSPGKAELSNRLSVAMDMKKLSAHQMAIRDKQKNPLSLTNAISRLIDDTILNPAITTRIGQAGTYAKNAVPKPLQKAASAISTRLPSSVKNTLTVPNLIRQSLNQ